MTNEEKILKILESMQGQINDMQTQMDGMQGQMSDMQGQINKTDRRIDTLQNDVMDLKEQGKENSGFIQAILHSQEFVKAKLEGLELTTAKTATVKIIEHKVKILNEDLFTQKAELEDLKLAK